MRVLLLRPLGRAGPAARRYLTTQPPPPPPPEDEATRRLRVLAASLLHVPKHGWTGESLARGCVDAGLPAVTHGIFKRGPIELVEYFMEESAYATAAELEARWGELMEGRSNAERMVAVINLRLKHLEPHVANWAQAMALGARPSHAATTARNLALLADEMCHAAGLTATDARWYTDRAVVGAVYGAAEVFMLRDCSPGFRDTKGFVARRVGDALRLASPEGASRVDEALGRLLPPRAVTALGVVASAGASALLGALASLVPAGAAPRPASWPGSWPGDGAQQHRGAPPPAGGGGGGSGVGGSGGSDRGWWSPAMHGAAAASGEAFGAPFGSWSSGEGDSRAAPFPPPPEDSPATASEAAEYDRKPTPGAGGAFAK